MPILVILVAILASIGGHTAASKVRYCLTSALTYKTPQQQNEIFRRCILHKAKADFYEILEDISHSENRRSKRQVYNKPPEVDENIVSAFLNSPEAVQMVLSYFKKQNKLTPPTVTTTTTTTPRPPPPRPEVSLQTLFGGAGGKIVGGSPPPPKRRRPRPPPPPLSFFFGGNKPLGQLLQEHRKNLKKIKEKEQQTTSTTPRPWSPPSNAINNPQLLGEKKDMEFFGLNDFVPQSPHNLPLRPMRLKYTSTKEFPSKTYGRLVPMPR